jgi:solute:Na+ symporter, SSS family
MVKIIMVVLYLGITALLGYLGYRHTKDTKDYLIGGRKVNPIIMAISYGATFISTSAIIGFGGAAAIFGMGELWLTFLNIFAGIFIAFVFFGKRTRRMGHNLDAHTFPELLGKRYDSKFIQKFIGLIIFIFMPLYAAAVMIGAAKFIENNLSINYDIALLVFAIVVAVYVFFGGLKGVMYTDTFQGALMLIGMSILIVSVYAKLGGITAAHQKLTELMNIPAVLDQIKSMKTMAGFTGWTTMPTFLSVNWLYLVTSVVLGVGIGVLAQPQLAVRFMTVKSDKELNRAVPAGGIFILMMTGVAFIVGALSNVFFFEKYGKLSNIFTEGNSGAIIPAFLKDFMPEWFTSLFLVVIVAAGMSTISGQFHAIGSAVGRDIFNSRGKSEKQTMLRSRIGMLIAIVYTIFLAFELPKIWNEAIVASTALFFGLCAAAFLPMFVGALYFRKMKKNAAVIGMISGFTVSLFWTLFVHAKESASLGLAKLIFNADSLVGKSSWSWVDPIVIALVTSIVVTVVLNKFLKEKPYEKSHIDNCFQGMK